MGENGGAQLLARWRRQQRTPGCSFLPFFLCSPTGRRGAAGLPLGKKNPFSSFLPCLGGCGGDTPAQGQDPHPWKFPRGWRAEGRAGGKGRPLGARAADILLLPRLPSSYFLINWERRSFAGDFQMFPFSSRRPHTARAGRRCRQPPAVTEGPGGSLPRRASRCGSRFPRPAVGDGQVLRGAFQLLPIALLAALWAISPLVAPHGAVPQVPTPSP